MTGLRDWHRDRDLPRRAGDGSLRPLDEHEALEVVARALPRADGPGPVACRWTYARWKPGVSLTCAYEVAFADDARATIVARRFADGAKRPSRRQVEHVARELAELSSPAPVLPPFAADGDTILWPARADRRLPGLRAAGDLRHLRRLLADAGLFEGRLLSRQRSTVEDVRYRPESRGVLRLAACLKPASGEGERLRTALAVRCLPPGVARRVAARRRALGGSDLVPALLAHEARTGLLLEPWLDVDVRAPDAFEHAGQAGAALAALHARPCPSERASSFAAPDEDLDALAACFAWDARLRVAARALLGPAPARDGARRWTHGDLHPDQVASARDGRPVLLDLDALHAGDATADLASWIADHLAEDASVAHDDAAGPLLEGYADGGGRPPAGDALRAWVAHELVRRAAASVRRLEDGACERALALLGRAAEQRAGGAA